MSGPPDPTPPPRRRSRSPSPAPARRHSGKRPRSASRSRSPTPRDRRRGDDPRSRPSVPPRGAAHLREMHDNLLSLLSDHLALKLRNVLGVYKARYGLLDFRGAVSGVGRQHKHMLNDFLLVLERTFPGGVRMLHLGGCSNDPDDVFITRPVRPEEAAVSSFRDQVHLLTYPKTVLTTAALYELHAHFFPGSFPGVAAFGEAMGREHSSCCRWKDVGGAAEWLINPGGLRVALPAPEPRIADGRREGAPSAERARERTPPERERRRERTPPGRDRRRERTPTPPSRREPSPPPPESGLDPAADEDIRAIALGLAKLVSEHLFIRASDVFGAFSAQQGYDARPRLLEHLPDPSLQAAARHISRRHGIPLLTADVRGAPGGPPITLLGMRRAASELASFPSFRDRLHGLVRPCTILPLEALWDLYSFLWHDVPSETAFRGRLEGEHRECCTRKDGKRTYKVNAWREPVRRLAVEEARERSPPKGGGYKGVVVHERRAGATAAEVLAALADAEAVAEDGDAAFQPLAEDDAPPSEVPSLRDNGSFASDGDVLTSDSGGGLLPHDRPPSEPAPLQEDGAPMGQATDAADSVDGGPAGELELAWMRVTAMTAVLELEDFDEAVWRYWDLAPGRPARVEQMS